MRKLKRGDFQELAKTRLREAGLLLTAGQFGGAYYFAGLSVECALKACIARQTEEHEFPDVRHAQDSWNHDLSRLLKTAGLEDYLTRRRTEDKQFETNWLTVKDWTVDSRYEERSEPEAGDLYTAASEDGHGILPWLQEYW